MGQLTTHILDTANGKPAANVNIRLYATGATRKLLSSTVSNRDGRTAAPLLAGDAMQSAEYELEFDIGPYFAALALPAPRRRFSNTVVIRCKLQAEQNYHVPLLVSPWSYSTYRGS